MALSEMYDHMVRWECLPFRIPGEKRKEKQRKEKKRKEKKKRVEDIAVLGPCWWVLLLG